MYAVVVPTPAVIAPVDDVLNPAVAVCIKCAVVCGLLVSNEIVSLLNVSTSHSRFEMVLPKWVFAPT